ncbi:uncharacterized protein LOC100823717 [Brachypodium distachyon]|uniref:Uncharacterized protein n=1 Tax=Brachypodium distachyon TaxID=15368 RepID=I1IRQ0_BRADI|nr:uncharacterized protein LOC100823717 [Brachypodium distachyon]KQJ90972.1 hypothetical protein BRADI_4g34918v3 [Brachypodium distachyon]|eukprot:XP_003578412.1 uncharacterized protein LOC100823717 [Brachypodium distachyon]
MKLGKAPELLKKAAAVCKSKTCVLAARLLVLASLRRRIATVGAISHALMASDRDKTPNKVNCDVKALVVVPRKAMATVGRKPVIVGDLSDQLAVFDQEDGDWTLHSLFDDDNCCYTGDEYEDEDQDGDDDDDGGVLVDDEEEDEEEPSVMDVIRNSREVEGVEFNMDDEIDQAAGMFIARCRQRMNRSF